LALAAQRVRLALKEQRVQILFLEVLLQPMAVAVVEIANH
jgi:hypothetical protein